jgi:transcriptional regulator with XRE-family HTH domain
VDTFEREANRAALSEFLRSRRARLSPNMFGLPLMKGRRTPGLRREEVAQLTGISIAYYTWIEQGRNVNMSAQVLNAIARELRFTPAERMHLFTLAGINESESVNVPGGEMHPTLAQFVYDPSKIGVQLYDRWFNVVDSNPIATAISGITTNEWPHCNILLQLFLDPTQQDRWVDWESEVRVMIGMLRQTLAKCPDSPEGKKLVASLTGNPHFDRIWAEYDVRQRPSPEEYFREEPWQVSHPVVGMLRIHRIAIAIPTNDESTMALLSPADDETQHKFKMLAGLAKKRNIGLAVSA